MEENKNINNSSKTRKVFHLEISRKDPAIKKFFLVLFSYIDSLIVLNLFLIVFSLGIITFGPTLFSVNESIVNITHNKSERLYSSFFNLFKKYFKLPYIFLGIILLIILGGSTYLSLFFFKNIFDKQYLIVPWILMIFLVLYSINVITIFILFNIRTTLPLKTCFQNGLYLASGSIKHSLFSSLSFIILFITPFIFIERTFILFIIVEFTFTILGCLLSYYSLVDKYVIYPGNEKDNELSTDKKDFSIKVESKEKETKEVVIIDDNQYDYSDSDSEEVI